MELRPIGFIRSPFPQKFGIPRQPELAPGAESVIRLDPEQIKPECMRGLDEVSHIWVLFHFHDPKDVAASTHRHTAELPAVVNWREEHTNQRLEAVKREAKKDDE